jgi:hypothetical protein
LRARQAGVREHGDEKQDARPHHAILAEPLANCARRNEDERHDQASLSNMASMLRSGEYEPPDAELDEPRKR